MTDGRSRRRVLTGVGTTVAVGLAGCSSDGGGTTEDGDSLFAVETIEKRQQCRYPGTKRPFTT